MTLENVLTSSSTIGGRVVSVVRFMFVTLFRPGCGPMELRRSTGTSPSICSGMSWSVNLLSSLGRTQMDDDSGCPLSCSGIAE